MRRIENLLNREIGLSARSIGSSAVEAAVKTRLRACGLPELSDYLTRVERDPLERAALVEEIVVSETWFFRDEEVFKALRRHASGWLGRERVLRVLSLPCATGEEAYSVSIALLDAGLRGARFTVRGVDVSERALGHARRAEYGKNSFRGNDGLLQRGYFEAASGSFRVVDAVREPVSFAKGNVLDPGLCPPGSCDVVLCRNLLIYLDPAARARALDNLWSWLVDDGLLFSGHAEAVEQMDARFQRLPASSPFAYGKQGHRMAAAKSQGTLRGAVAARTVTASRSPARPKAGPPPPTGTGSEATAVPPAPRVTLALATELANRGNLREARQLCERAIAESGASPEAYCLLGVIGNAAGQREDAITSFNKSLYLDPNNYEALVHLALLHEQRGEAHVAANFRRRAERARRSDGK